MSTSKAPVPSTSSGTTTLTTTAPVATASTAMSKWIISQYDSTNYYAWSMQMQNVLKECGLKDYVKLQAKIMDYNTDKDQQALMEIIYTVANRQMEYLMNVMMAHKA